MLMWQILNKALSTCQCAPHPSLKHLTLLSRTQHTPFTSQQSSKTLVSVALVTSLIMASASIAMAVARLPSPSATGRRQPLAAAEAFANPKRLPAMAATNPMGKPLKVQASSSAKEQVVAGLTAAALAAAMVIPDVAEAAQPGLSPSLKNFILSIVSGGVVLGVIVGVVIGVANFDPVKRT